MGLISRVSSRTYRNKFSTSNMGFQGKRKGGAPVANAKIVYVYGFNPAIEEEQFRAEFTAPFPDMQIAKVDFFKKKLQAFIHCTTHEDAQKVIDQWDKKMMDGTDQLHSWSTNAERRGDIFLPPVYKKGRPFQPKSVENEGHDKHGHAREVLMVEGFDADVSYNRVFNIFAAFGPIYTLTADIDGKFVVRYCYDLSNDFALKHLVDMKEESPLAKNDENWPTGLILERSEELEQFV